MWTPSCLASDFWHFEASRCICYINMTWRHLSQNTNSQQHWCKNFRSHKKCTAVKMNERNAQQICGRIASQWVNGKKTTDTFMKGKMESLNKACPKLLGNLHCQSYVYWTMHHLQSWIKRNQLDVTCFIISLFNAQRVSDVNTSILRSLQIICWVISWVVLLWFDLCWCYIVVWLGWCGIHMQASASSWGWMY